MSAIRRRVIAAAVTVLVSVGAVAAPAVATIDRFPAGDAYTYQR